MRREPLLISPSLKGRQNACTGRTSNFIEGEIFRKLGCTSPFAEGGIKGGSETQNEKLNGVLKTKKQK